MECEITSKQDKLNKIWTGNEEEEEEEEIVLPSSNIFFNIDRINKVEWWL